jgi:hypothetical protein
MTTSTPTQDCGGRRFGAGRRGSVIVVILALITLAAFLISRFVERTMTEMIVESRARLADRLRGDAHTALEATLAVLADYQALDNGLRSPAQGWGDPLAGLELPTRAGTAVEVDFEDETGRPSLPRLDAPALVALGLHLGLKETEATLFAEALLVWTKKDQTSARFETDPRNYEYRDPPHRPPGRPLASFDELAAIAGVRELFYEPDGRPNELHAKFARTVSLHDFPAINLNTAGADALVLAGLDVNQAAQLLELNSGAVRRAPGTPPYFRSVAEAQALLGATTPLDGFDTLVRCLRVRVTVREGATAFQLIATVSPGSAGQAADVPAGATATATAGAAAKSLSYPFTLLAIEEKIELAPPPVS